MPHLLHLDSSARRQSFSRTLSGAFADAWRAAGGSITYRDLAAEPVPPINEAWTEICDFLLAHSITALDELDTAVRTPEQAAAWKIVEPLLNELIAADVVLIGAPMYNYSIPSSLKAWIDQVTFPRMSLAGRKIVVASARGGSYLPGAPKAVFDHQARFLQDFAQGHFAIDDVTFIHAELANSVVDPALAHLHAKHEESLSTALSSARALAGELISTATR
ncbi:NAD(P)H-dependent oxidoreductase [Streptomyces sp. FZ201]|uniref:FMN-dependent NADH-azoreductase n=1 Tax=Streptomyces sp. FZ201 TaxID=3057122 RepID=UPI0021BE1F7D|nr:NAD(P)H-dependent oxidoreductase [Streptomyces sp. FZ201]